MLCIDLNTDSMSDYLPHTDVQAAVTEALLALVPRRDLVRDDAKAIDFAFSEAWLYPDEEPTIPDHRPEESFTVLLLPAVKLGSGVPYSRKGVPMAEVLKKALAKTPTLRSRGWAITFYPHLISAGADVQVPFGVKQTIKAVPG